MKHDRHQSTLAVVPAYNEGGNIAQVIDQIRANDRGIDILVIDDGSHDGTSVVARRSGAKVISLSTNMGYGVALQTGYKYAFEHGYDYLVQLDADGQHDPSYIPELLKTVQLGRADLVLGSRFLQEMPSKHDGLRVYVPGIFRRIGIRLFAFLTTSLVGFRVTDPTSGYQAFNRAVITFFTHDFFPCDYPDADVIVLAHRAGFKIKEVPMVIYESNGGRTMHSGTKPLYYAFKMLLSLSMTLIRRRPVLSHSENI
jgi:hypothetical protein